VEVNTALKQIEKGAYGTCVVCGAEIEKERLDANPAAQTCKLHM
jgi:RNA polymerase-binding transcription factor DksA